MVQNVLRGTSGEPDQSSIRRKLSAAGLRRGALTEGIRFSMSRMLSTSRNTRTVITPVPPARHLLRAKDLIDARYREQLDVAALARAARLSTAHFSREFRRSFGETPHQYLL